MIFRLGATGITFSHAASGYLDGKVEFAGHWHAVRRVDGDGNGLFTDLKGPRWNFVFSDIGRRGEARWYKVEQGGTVAIDPIGNLEFKTGPKGMRPPRPGEDFQVQPQLFTGDGLLIVTCYWGMLASPAGDSGTGASITLATTDGRTLGTAHSGFA